MRTRGWRSRRRIEANRLVLEALAEEWRSDPRILSATELGLLRMYGALRRLRQLGMVETRRRTFWRAREHRQVQDEAERDDGRVRPVETTVVEGEVEPWIGD